jgi:hypothetical protein
VHKYISCVTHVHKYISCVTCISTVIFNQVDLSDLSSLESSFFSLLSFFVLSRVKVRSRTTICRPNFIFMGRIMSNEANNVAIGQSKVIIIIKEILLASR